jgi:hypothetical protein
MRLGWLRIGGRQLSGPLPCQTDDGLQIEGGRQVCCWLLSGQMPASQPLGGGKRQDCWQRHQVRLQARLGGRLLGGRRHG